MCLGAWRERLGGRQTHCLNFVRSVPSLPFPGVTKWIHFADLQDPCWWNEAEFVNLPGLCFGNGRFLNVSFLPSPTFVHFVNITHQFVSISCSWGICVASVWRDVLRLRVWEGWNLLLAIAFFFFFSPSGNTFQLFIRYFSWNVTVPDSLLEWIKIFLISAYAVSRMINLEWTLFRESTFRSGCVQSLIVTPWTVACQVPLSMGSLRQECWSGLPFPSPRDLPDPRIKPAFLASPALAGRLFITVPLEEMSKRALKDQQCSKPLVSPNTRARSLFLKFKVS